MSRDRKIDPDPAALANLLVDRFLEAQPRPPKQIVLDLDAADDPLHGQQEGRFLHGGYLPLDVFCGWPLAVLLRRSKIDVSAGAVEAAARIKPGRGSRSQCGAIKVAIAAACPYRTEFALADLRLATWTGPPPARTVA